MNHFKILPTLILTTVSSTNKPALIGLSVTSLQTRFNRLFDFLGAEFCRCRTESRLCSLAFCVAGLIRGSLRTITIPVCTARFVAVDFNTVILRLVICRGLLTCVDLMGVHQLSKVIGDNAPKAIKSSEIKSYFGMFRL